MKKKKRKILTRKLIIEILEAQLKEMEEALKSNLQYPNEVDFLEGELKLIKRKKGWFIERRKKRLKKELKKAIEKPKYLNGDSRRWLENQIVKHKSQIAFAKQFKDDGSYFRAVEELKETEEKKHTEQVDWKSMIVLFIILMVIGLILILLASKF